MKKVMCIYTVGVYTANKHNFTAVLEKKKGLADIHTRRGEYMGYRGYSRDELTTCLHRHEEAATKNPPPKAPSTSMGLFSLVK